METRKIELSDMQLLYAAEMTVADTVITNEMGGSSTHQLIELVLVLHRNSVRHRLQPIFLSADVARTVAQQLLDGAGRADTTGRTQSLN